MKSEIHPDMKKTTITCACGEEYETISTREDIRVEVCSSCHPFFTGRKNKSAQGGRIERFNEKFGFSDEDEEVTVEDVDEFEELESVEEFRDEENKEEENEEPEEEKQIQKDNAEDDDQ